MSFGRLERTPGPQPMSEINMTPLVDVMLVLVVIFIITAPLLVSAVKVDLPKASTGDETQKSTISLTLSKGGDLFYNEKQVTEEQAKSMITTEAGANKDVQAIIAADKGVDYGRVMHLIDLVKALGVTKFALNIDAAP